MLALRRPQWNITGLEIQPQLHRLAVSNAQRCNVDVRFLEADLNTYQNPEPFDLILSNPPWQKRFLGRPSPQPSREISRRELLCDLEGVLRCVKRNLCPQGNALLLYPRSRLTELQEGAAKTLLDIFDALPATGLKNEIICRIRHKG